MEGYRATKDQAGILTVHDVPIFVECQRGEHSFDQQWIEMAVQAAYQAAAEGYHPPLHLRHHESAVDVKAAGYFRIKGTTRITFKGSPRLAVVADLVVTDPEVQEHVLAQRLPYRSVEIFDVDTPRIDSLALLDHEAPYLELPMLMVSNIADAQTMSAGVSLARVANPFPNRSGNLVACFQRGQSAHVLWSHPAQIHRESNFSATTQKGSNSTSKLQRASEMADEEKKEGEEMQEGEGAAMDVGAIVKAIEDGSISVADMEAIVAAVEARKAAVAPEEEEAVEEAPETAMADDYETKDKVEMARLLGETKALKARLEQRDRDDRRKEDVAAALKVLANRPLGANLETELLAFHRKFGSDAFKEHVRTIEKTFSTYESDPRAAFFANQTRAHVPEIANRYVEQGVEAVDKAAKFAREYELLRQNGHMRMSLERYVELNMSRS